MQSALSIWKDIHLDQPDFVTLAQFDWNPELTLTHIFEIKW